MSCYLVFHDSTVTLIKQKKIAIKYASNKSHVLRFNDDQEKNLLDYIKFLYSLPSEQWKNYYSKNAFEEFLICSEQKNKSNSINKNVVDVKKEELTKNSVQKVADVKKEYNTIVGENMEEITTLQATIQQVAEFQKINEPITLSDKIRVDVNPTDWEIFTDGSFFPFSQKAGYCAILILGKKDDMPLQISGGVLDLDSSYQVEEYAIFKALEKLDTLRPYGDVHFYCDCLPLVKLLNNFLKDENAVDVNNIDSIMSEILQYLKDRDKSKKYEFHHVPGHSGIKFNEQCDKIARLENELL